MYSHIDVHICVHYPYNIHMYLNIDRQIQDQAHFACDINMMLMLRLEHDVASDDQK